MPCVHAWPAVGTSGIGRRIPAACLALESTRGHRPETAECRPGAAPACQPRPRHQAPSPRHSPGSHLDGRRLGPQAGDGLVAVAQAPAEPLLLLCLLGQAVLEPQLHLGQPVRLLLHLQVQLGEHAFVLRHLQLQLRQPVPELGALLQPGAGWGTGQDPCEAGSPWGAGTPAGTPWAPCSPGCARSLRRGPPPALHAAPAAPPRSAASPASVAHSPPSAGPGASPGPCLPAESAQGACGQGGQGEARGGRAECVQGQGRGARRQREREKRKGGKRGREGAPEMKMKRGEKDGEDSETGTAPAAPCPPSPYFPECESHTWYLYRVHTPISHPREKSPPAPGCHVTLEGLVKVASIQEHFPGRLLPPSGCWAHTPHPSSGGQTAQRPRPLPLRDALVASPALIGGGSLPGPG